MSRGTRPSFWKQVQILNQQYCEQVIKPEESIKPFQHSAFNARRCALKQGRIVNF